MDLFQSKDNDVFRKVNDDDDDDGYSDCEKDMFCMEKDDNNDKMKAKKCSQTKITRNGRLLKISSGNSTKLGEKKKCKVYFHVCNIIGRFHTNI